MSRAETGRLVIPKRKSGGRWTEENECARAWPLRLLVVGSNDDEGVLVVAAVVVVGVYGGGE